MKQQATFGSVIGFLDFEDKGISVRLADIQDHPMLGDPPAVTTSRVERIEYGEGGLVNTVETKNTIYTRR